MSSIRDRNHNSDGGGLALKDASSNVGGGGLEELESVFNLVAPDWSRGITISGGSYEIKRPCWYNAGCFEAANAPDNLRIISVSETKEDDTFHTISGSRCGYYPGYYNWHSLGQGMCMLRKGNRLNCDTTVYLFPCFGDDITKEELSTELYTKLN